MNYATIKKHDIANGDGVRVSVFVSGCRNQCKGCFNPELWRFDYGEQWTDATENEIMQLLDRFFIDGLSVLGGDPLEPENAIVLTPFLKRVKEKYPGKTIWLYTGYTFENVKDMEIMQYIDVLVDGRFVLELKNPKLRFKGSENQRIIYLNERANHELRIN